MTKIFSPENSFHLSQLDSKQISESKGSVRCFIVERNESVKLPYLLKYYRDLGVDEFFIIDDHSSDGSREFVLAQDDCFVFEPSNSFKESSAGVDWQNLLLNNFGIDCWTIVVDADELLAYPHSEKINIKDFCKFLDDEGSNLFFAFLLDMYPRGDLNSGKCTKNVPFTEICPYFDRDYTFRNVSRFSSPLNEYPRVRVVGGPRLRNFYPLQKRTDLISRVLKTVIIKISDKLKFIKGDRPHHAPALIKMPLVKWQKGFKRLSNHIVSAADGGKVSEITGAILHFKFFADFHEKAVKEVLRGEHFGGSLEYKRYLKSIQKNQNLSLMYEGSVKYTGSDALLKERLINSTERYEKYALSK